MRDKNPSFKQFYIQLEKTCLKFLDSNFNKFFASAVLATPTPLTLLPEVKVRYPRTFRAIRSLCILHWWMPEKVFWQIHLDLSEKSFEHFNQKQQLEIKILLESREICSTYLFESKSFSSNQLFGNFLGNDALELVRVLKWSWNFQHKAKRKVRRRGYQDKGSRKPISKWKPTSDWSLTEIQNRKDEIHYRQHRTAHRLFRILRTISDQNGYFDKMK